MLAHKEKYIVRLEGKVQIQKELRSKQTETEQKLAIMQDRMRVFGEKYKPYIEELKRTGRIAELSDGPGISDLKKQVQALIEKNALLALASSPDRVELAMALHARLAAERDGKCDLCCVLGKDVEALRVELEAVREDLAVQSKTALLKNQAFRTQFAYLSDVEKVTAINEGKGTLGKLARLSYWEMSPA